MIDTPEHMGRSSILQVAFLEKAMDMYQ
jgi:hypothetical protein